MPTTLCDRWMTNSASQWRDLPGWQISAQDDPKRKTVVSERSNFPTDLYIAEAVC